MDNPNGETVFGQFCYEPQLNAKKTEEKGINIYDKVEFIKVSDPNRPNFSFYGKATADHKKRFAASYKAFLERGEEPEDGITPLEMVPIFTVDHIATLKDLGIRNLDQFSALTKAELSGLPAAIQNLHKRALKYQEAAADTGAMSARLVRANDLNEALTEEVATLKASLAEADKEIKALQERARKAPATSRKTTKVA